jgi:hypothetical protein
VTAPLPSTPLEDAGLQLLKDAHVLFDIVRERELESVSGYAGLDTADIFDPSRLYASFPRLEKLVAPALCGQPTSSKAHISDVPKGIRREVAIRAGYLTNRYILLLASCRALPHSFRMRSDTD